MTTARTGVKVILGGEDRPVVYEDGVRWAVDGDFLTVVGASGPLASWPSSRVRGVYHVTEPTLAEAALTEARAARSDAESALRDAKAAREFARLVNACFEEHKDETDDTFGWFLLITAFVSVAAFVIGVIAL